MDGQQELVSKSDLGWESQQDLGTLTEQIYLAPIIRMVDVLSS